MSPPSWTSLPPPTPSHPSRLLQSPGLISLSHTAISHWISILHMVMYMLGFPGGANGKEPPCQWRRNKRCGLIPGSGRTPGVGPLQYSCLEKPMDRGAWPAAVQGMTKSQTWLSDLAAAAAVYMFPCYSLCGNSSPLFPARVTPWIDVETVTENEVSQKKKNTCCILTHIKCYLKKIL